MGIECPQLRQQTTPSGARFPQFGHRLFPTHTPPTAVAEIAAPWRTRLGDTILWGHDDKTGKAIWPGAQL
jgi:hypothetical protein